MAVVEETSSFAADVSFVCFLTAFACAFASAFASAASAAAPSGSRVNRGALWTARRSGSHRFSCHVSAYSYRPSVSSASPRGTNAVAPAFSIAAVNARGTAMNAL